MAALFRRPDPDDDLEDGLVDPGEIDAGRPLLEVPSFAVIVSEISTDGWHMAAVIGESATPDFYVRAVTVRWPFLIARPAPSNRLNHKPVAPEALSPTGTTPAHRLVVNWAWVTVEGTVSQLRFYVKRTVPRLFRTSSAVRVRVTLKEVPPPHRRIVVALKSNRITWNPRDPEMPASPPEQST